MVSAASTAKSAVANERYRPALAGLLGGGLATLILHPLDLLKTRQAVHCNGNDGEAKRR